MAVPQKEAETSDSDKGAVKAVQDLYDVVRHDVLSVDMRSLHYLLWLHSDFFFTFLSYAWPTV